MKNLLTLTLLLILTSFTPVKADTQYDAIVRADGIVCDFCAQALNKVFLKNENVEKIDVSMDEGTVSVKIKKGGTVTDEEIQKMIEWGGYDFVSVTRP
ncbi:MAG: heavy-metal-associated domain-containing protein [Alphaproteobacteria bacterium]|nr:heavy-metal-associated domain-containing protein [Alphaproteobacteria bacterium]NCQ88324.1 heavy-metal-associated domain-containing protein [Alphaproteobacteria bacterium]NCT05148.1 heavy-metal-associated domain-containing protein [Alphaproteobacteria bacterium]